MLEFTSEGNGQWVTKERYDDTQQGPTKTKPTWMCNIVDIWVQICVKLLMAIIIKYFWWPHLCHIESWLVITLYITFCILHRRNEIL